MKPEKALELVRRYSRLTRSIKTLDRRIGDAIELCHGISGKRQEIDRWGFPLHERELDTKNREIDVHLYSWYKPYTADSGAMYPSLAWHQINEAKHKKECPHCYAAHLAIQERKAARKSLASVKGAMTRHGGKP